MSNHPSGAPATTEMNTGEVKPAVSDAGGQGLKQSNKPVIDPSFHGFIDNAATSSLLDTPRSSKILLWGVVCFVVVALVWAYMAELDEITRGEGMLFPPNRYRLCNILKGGFSKSSL